jgi:diacylglycerol kinase family enzyme
MRLALVANDASGGRTDVARVAALLRGHGAAVGVHGLDALAAVPAGRPDRVVVAGGDGSIGPVAAMAAGADLPLGVVPTGTANDFASALGLPMAVEDACALAAAPDAAERPVDLARAGERPFLNAASAGLSVPAARTARPLKPRLGPVAYAAGALRAGLTARPLRCRVAVDGQEAFAGAAWQLIVAGTGAFGGGATLDAADPADALLDVAVLRAGPRIALVRSAWAMRTGGLTELGDVLHARGREVVVTGAARFNVDGEVCEVPGGRFAVRGERVCVLVP